MTEDVREQIALFRFKLISPVLAEPGRVQNGYFRSQAAIEHDMPHQRRKRLTVSTLKLWLRLYRKYGFDGLKPKPRSDLGRPRKLGEDHLAAIRGKCKAFPHWSVKMLHEDLVKNNLLGEHGVCYNTLLRVVNREGLLPPDGRTDARKRFEMDEANELWICDFMHGPLVSVGNRSSKAILCAIIDDHSRMIVGAAFSPNETLSALVVVLKQAFLAFGIPKRLYVDNGAAFSADLLVKSCAQAGVSLIHSKPYDSPSRGKIERFFRTVRDRFLADLAGEMTMDAINDSFSRWLNEDYHHKLHSGTDTSPADRYNASAGRVPILRLSSHELDQIFLVRHERIVGNDATISFKGRIYEVPSAYIREHIEIRHPVDDDSGLFLFDNGARIAKLKLVNPAENSRIFRPSSCDSQISFSSGKVK
jgi:transposase InsO family protein